jgi:endonuclease-3 related protein
MTRARNPLPQPKGWGISSAFDAPAFRRGSGKQPDRKVRHVVADILARLDVAYDFSAWHWQRHTPPEYVCISAVLVQHTNWRNVERAIERLQAAAAFSLEAIALLPEERLAELVRPVGTPAVKARRLHALAQLAREAGGLDRLLALPAVELRARLLATHGIGPETADAIALNAAGRAIFQVDAYTVRCFRRLGLGPAANGYDAWQRWFEEGLAQPISPPLAGEGLGEGSTAELYRRYHGLLVLHGKQTCRPRPRCAACCLLELCPTGQTEAGARTTEEVAS